MSPDLDRWLPDPVIRLRHRREARADPARLWEAASSVTLADSHLLGRVVRWRLPGVPADMTYRELFSRHPFAVLEEAEQHSVSGCCGRIWTRKREFKELPDPDAFRSCDAAGTARVLFAHWVEAVGGDRAALVSEVRVVPADRHARRGLRLVRPLIVAFEHLISGEALAVATRRAEHG